MGLLIKNGVIVTASDTYRADILVEGEKIVMIGAYLPSDDHQVYDAGGKYVLPGGVDVHTHLELPVSGTVSSDDFYTGQVAAAFGGTTTHIDFPIQAKGGSLRQALDTWHAKADGKAAIDYGFHMTITDMNPEVAREIPDIVTEGVTSLKLLMAYKNSVMVDDTTIFRVMRIAAEQGLLVMVHAENGDAIAELVDGAVRSGNLEPRYHALTRPALLEGEATGRAIALSAVTQCPLYIVHMTCRESLQQLRTGRAMGLPVMGETCVQYLLLTQADLERTGHEGAKFVCSPPLRTPEDNHALWDALRDGTLQVVSTDHCPFWFEGGQNGRPAGKELGKENFSLIPNGLPTIEERLKLVWTHGVGKHWITPNRFVALNSTNPAKSFGLYPRKGTIMVGSDADIVIWDAGKSGTISDRTHHMNVDYSAFQGMPFKGSPLTVFLRGRLIVDGYRWLGKAGSGHFLKRSAYAPVL